MKAAICKSLDGTQALVIEDIPAPEVTAGKVLVAVKAIGLNFADTLITRGKYQIKPELPFAPGAEIAGEVRALGAGVAGFRPGERVMAYVSWGGASEQLLVDPEMLVKVPDGVPDTIAAGLSVTYGTAMHGLVDRGRLKAGETVVVTGAAGGAGLAAVEIATLIGARVLAVASTEDKLAIAAAAGADAGILFPGADLKQSVRDATGGRGADVVYECVGGEAAEPLLRALAWQGRFLVVGFASGAIPKLPLNLLLVKGAEAVGVFWGEAVRRDPAAHRAGMQQVLAWVRDGRLKPKTHGVFPLSEIREALAVLEGRQAQGKVVVTL